LYYNNLNSNNDNISNDETYFGDSSTIECGALSNTFIQFLSKLKISHFTSIIKPFDENDSRISHYTNRVQWLHRLCDTKKKYSTLFSLNPFIYMILNDPSVKSDGSNKMSNKVSVYLSMCPSDIEVRNIMKLIMYTSHNAKTNNNSDDSTTTTLLQTNIKSLKVAYKTSIHLIRLIDNVIGLFNARYIYKCDYKNWDITNNFCILYGLGIYGYPSVLSNKYNIHQYYTTYNSVEKKLVEAYNQLSPILNSQFAVIDVQGITQFIISSAITGKFKLLYAFYQSALYLRYQTNLLSPKEPNHAISKNMRQHLVWHVLMCSPTVSTTPVNKNKRNSIMLNFMNYENIILLLLSHGEMPSCPENAYQSCLDVAILKQMDNVTNFLLTNEK
jgi:hypothetical protein